MGNIYYIKWPKYIFKIINFTSCLNISWTCFYIISNNLMFSN